MKVISLLNLKGGVAKSFTAVNFGYELWRRGYKVLLLDNDKQGNLSKGYGRYSPCCGSAQDFKKFVTSYTGKGR